jgi:hypothetical protein
MHAATLNVMATGLESRPTTFTLSDEPARRFFNRQNRGVVHQKKPRRNENHEIMKLKIQIL